jgi:hypothetical protein
MEVDCATETETVPLFKWLATVNTASRTLVFASGTGPSRVVPLASSLMSPNPCVRERIIPKTTKAANKPHTNTPAHLIPEPVPCRSMSMTNWR